MMLFGPGVKNITAAKTTKAMRSDCDMFTPHAIFGNGLRPLRQQHDGDAADHGDHAGQPQRSEVSPNTMLDAAAPTNGTSSANGTTCAAV